MGRGHKHERWGWIRSHRPLGSCARSVESAEVYIWFETMSVYDRGTALALDEDHS